MPIEIYFYFDFVIRACPQTSCDEIQLKEKAIFIRYVTEEGRRWAVV